MRGSNEMLLVCQPLESFETEISQLPPAKSVTSTADCRRELQEKLKNDITDFSTWIRRIE